MARIPRVELPGFPHHVTQRGNRRLQTFYCDADYRAYIGLLAEARNKASVSIWAYCLMPNHVHLVVVPSAVGGLRDLMQHPHRRYAWRINRRMDWQGHLWQARFYSCPLDEAHLVAAVRYIEMNPVRAGLCADPFAWRWSSVHAHVRGRNNELVDVDPMLERISDWRGYLGDSSPGSLVDTIRQSVSTGRPAGDDSFVAMAEEQTGQRLRKLCPGPVPRRLRN